MRIRKVVDKDGVNAAVAVNVNEPGSVTAASSVQKEEGTELPDREGTYDELREEATKADEQSNEGEQDD
jgi:hypothetical protein